MAKTVAEIRAEIEASKKLAKARFAADWGTSSMEEVMDALAKTIPCSASPAAAARKARAIVQACNDAC